MHNNKGFKLVPIIVLACSLMFPVQYANALDDFTIGVFPRRDATLTIQMFTPLQQYLSDELQQPVRLETAANFEAFMSRVRAGRYDLIHLNQYQYIQVNESHGYEVIAQNEEQGEKTIRGAIFVRADSSITQPSQLTGKRIIFGGGKTAMMSYIVPTYLLQQAGLKTTDYFRQFAISPPNSVIAVYLGHADAGGAGEIVQRLKVVTSRIPSESIVPLLTSEPLAHLPWATSNDMAPELKSKIRALLTGLKNDDDGRAILKRARLTGINPASDNDYDVHRDIIEAVNAGL